MTDPDQFRPDLSRGTGTWDGMWSYSRPVPAPPQIGSLFFGEARDLETAMVQVNRNIEDFAVNNEADVLSITEPVITQRHSSWVVMVSAVFRVHLEEEETP